LCLERGDTVVADDIADKFLDSLRKEVTDPEQQKRLICQVCNVCDKESVSSAAEAVKKSVGTLDGVVNFAGLLRVGPLVEIDDRDFQSTLDVNVGGTWRVNRYFFELLQPKKGRIINISSEVAYAKFPQAFNGPYCMSKIGLDAYTTALRMELKKLDMPVITIYSGAMKTPLLNSEGFGKAALKPNTQFQRELLVVEKTAHEYMLSNGHDPMMVSEAVYKALHTSSPKNHYLVGVSFTMRACRYVPQPLLDIGMAMQLKFGKPAPLPAKAATPAQPAPAGAPAATEKKKD